MAAQPLAQPEPENDHTVRWHSTSVLVHSVTDVPKKAINKPGAVLPKHAQPFNSELMDPGAQYEHRFEQPGTYVYFCIPHEAAGMIGIVVVKPQSQSRQQK